MGAKNLLNGNKIGKKSKSGLKSTVIKTEIVCPSETNPMGILQGGKLVQWMDIAAAVCAQTHAGRLCVTASIDKVNFRHPARVGDIITIKANMVHAFRTSMKILVHAWSTNVESSKRVLISESNFTFVAINRKGKPARVLSFRSMVITERNKNRSN